MTKLRKKSQQLVVKMEPMTSYLLYTRLPTFIQHKIGCHNLHPSAIPKKNLIIHIILSKCLILLVALDVAEQIHHLLVTFQGQTVTTRLEEPLPKLLPCEGEEHLLLFGPQKNAQNTPAAVGGKFWKKIL